MLRKRTYTGEDDGKYQLILASNCIRISSNYGRTWTEIYKIAGISGYMDGCISRNGQFIAIINAAWVFISSDYGQTWKIIRSRSEDGKAIAISEDGRYMAIASDSGCSVSADFGETWNMKGISGHNEDIAAMSSSGQYILFSSKFYGTTHVSSNYGQTFNLILDRPSDNIATGYKNFAAISGNGKYIVRCADFYFSISSDYGTTWAHTKMDIVAEGKYEYSYNYIHISYTGKEMIAVGSQYILLSTDYGQNWIVICPNMSGIFKKISTSENRKYSLLMSTYSAYSSLDCGKTHEIIYSSGETDRIRTCCVSKSIK